jgi:predicted transposase YbfD/YdcC
MERIVVEKDADFLIQVKANAPRLQETLEHALRKNKDNAQTAQTIDKGHGRIETRSIELVPVTPTDTGWPHTHSVCRVTRSREILRKGEVIDRSDETSLYVGSFSTAQISSETAAQTIRGHWTIENCLHHRKDRSMGEDRCRASAKGIGRVMCCIRSITALMLGRAKQTLKVVQRRLASKTHLLIAMLSSTHLDDWLKRHKPFKLKQEAGS